MPIKELAVAIIAGGQSQRFGSPKALAKFKGKKLIDHAVALAKELSDQILLIYGQENLFEEQEGIILIRDEEINQGPLMGIYTALKNSPHEWLATIPCDSPLLSKKIYRQLQEEKKPGSRLLIANCEGQDHCLVALWHVSVASDIESYLTNGKRSIKGFLQKIKYQGVEFKDIDLFKNINHKSDL